MVKKLNCKTGHRWDGWLQAATLTAGVAVASTAHAAVDAGATIPGEQSGSVTVAIPTRGQLRTKVNRQHWISYQDCVDDIEIRFALSVSTPVTSVPLIAIVSQGSVDCLQNSYRSDTSVCRRLDVSAADQGSPLVIIKAKDLTQKMGFGSCGDAVADAGTNPAGISLKFYFMVDPPSEDLIVDSSKYNFAIYNDSGIDLWGPDAPTDLRLVSGDEELQLNFVSGSSSDKSGFYFYSDDGTGVPDGGVPLTTSSGGGSSSTTATTGGSTSSAATTTGVGSSTSTSTGTTTSGAGGAGGASASSSTGAGGAGGAGGASTSSSTSSAGAGGASTSSASAGVGGSGGVATGPLMSTGVVGSGSVDACKPTSEKPVCTAASKLLVSGEVPSYSHQGELVTVGNQGTLSGLKNGQAYVVAVAAYDDVGNVGELSELECGTPQPVISILRAYECAGGFTESGCGFCSVGGDQGVSYTALVSAGLFVFGFAARRSRRPRVASAARGVR